VTVKAVRYAEISAARVIRVPLIQQIELGEMVYKFKEEVGEEMKEEERTRGEKIFI
jgi:hypothetical protein